MFDVKKIDESFYPEHEDHWDDKLFRSVILKRLCRDANLLDLGAGAGVVAEMNFRGIVARVVGVDLDQRVLENPYLDEAIVGDVGLLPFPNGEFDVVVADNVLEHLCEPDRVFAEVARVLKPGGVFLFKTPNRYHYVAVLASLLPLAFHRFYNKLRGRLELDTFPTKYRANSRASIHELARVHDFVVEDLMHIEGRPEYLRLNRFMYIFGLLYERVVNSSTFFNGLRVLLIGVLERKRGS